MADDERDVESCMHDMSNHERRRHLVHIFMSTDHERDVASCMQGCRVVYAHHENATRNKRGLGTLFTAKNSHVQGLREIAFFRAISAIGIAEITRGDMNICERIAQYSQFTIIFLCSFCIDMGAWGILKNFRTLSTFKLEC